MNKPQTVKDIIAHLQTLPPNMEVWETWDESGEYWPATEPQGRIDWVVRKRVYDDIRWVSSYDDGKGKPVCVLLANIKGTNTL